MAKQLNVNLAFTADTAAAKTQIENLQQSLTELLKTTSKSTKNFDVNSELVKASKAAAMLKINLESATNVNTGKLDLGRFVQQMNESGMTLKKYKDALSNLGSAGDEAFAQLARSITTAELPLKRTNALLSNMWVTLKNTMRWQISSSVINGLSGSISSAFRYAEDLNESLNNIRIVSGQNAEQMAIFAEEANKAAKALNTTTVAYTNAALIYYQQGLSEEEVKERTDITVQMANVTGENAEQVSSYMTAIWNNFDNGSESLSHYADVMTALGAATASSTDEIAAGLEKFASITDMIGLSYEYATSALATVTAITRQSPDVVGTAFKTIFARIQGLKLGETLDDGTDLNKYSESLNKVGISIFDLNGELKNMDTILEEMGSKWKSLSKDQQVALAQAVAGVRQYNQLVSLMDNWDYFHENLQVAENSTGELNKQSEIFADSWEAASKRVKTAAESVYSALINDDFFIELNNIFADILSGIGETIKAAGGLKTILIGLGSVALTAFRDQILKSIKDVQYNFKMLTPSGRESVNRERENANNLLLNITRDTGSFGGSVAADAYQKQAILQQTLIDNSSKMSIEQQKIAQYLLDAQNTMAQEVILSGQTVDNLEKQAAITERKALKGIQDKEQIKILQNLQLQYQGIVKEQYIYRKALEDIDLITNKASKTSEVLLEKDRKKLLQIAAILDENGVSIQRAFGDEAQAAFNVFFSSIEEGEVNLKELKSQIDSLFATSNDIGSDVGVQIENILSANGRSSEEIRDTINSLQESYRQLGEEVYSTSQQLQGLNQYTEEVQNSMNQLSSNYSLSEMLIATASTIGNVFTLLNSGIALIRTLSDGSLSAGEKIGAVLANIAFILPSIISLLNAQNISLLLNLASRNRLIRSIMMFGSVEAGTTGAIELNTAATGANAAMWLAHPIGWVIGLIIAATAAITALTYGIMRLTEWLTKGNRINTENCETLIESSEKTKELTEKNNELSDSLEELIKNYEDLNNRGESSIEVLDSIKEKLPEVIDSYKGLANTLNKELIPQIDKLEALGNLANLTGDYSDFLSLKEQLDNKLIESQSSSSYAGAQASSKILASKLRDLNGQVVDNNTIIIKLAGGLSGNDAKAVKYLQEALGENFNSKMKAKSYSGSITINDYEDPTKFVEIYEKMLTARNKMISEMSNEQLESSKIFKSLNDTLNETSSEYDKLKQQTSDYLQVVQMAIEVQAGSTDNLDTMDEYLKYREKYLKIALEQYKLTEEQALGYLNEVENLKALNNQYQLAAIMAKKIANIDIEDNSFANAKINYLKDFSQQGISEMSDQEIEIALNIAMSTDSIEEFISEFEHTILDVTTRSFESSGKLAIEAMNEGLKEGKIDFTSLISDDNFKEYLKTINKNQLDLMSATYEEQYSIISDFYSKTREQQIDSINENQNLYRKDLATKQAELTAYYDAIQGESAKNIENLKSQYANLKQELSETDNESEIERINKEIKELEEKFQKDYHFEITSNADIIQSEIDNIIDSIQELQDQKIEMAMDWSGVDAVEGELKQLSKFTKMIREDTKKVGDSYQLTAAQAREWLEFYPELGEIAITTDQGIIEMNSKKVDAFIDGQENIVDNSIDGNIKRLEGEKTTLEAELELKKIDLQAAQALAEGRMNLEDTTSQYLIDLRSNLTDYFIECGLDEQAANAAALETMGLNEKEYTVLVADAAKTNANNMKNSAEDQGNSQVESLRQVSQHWAKFVNYIAHNIAPMLKNIIAAAIDPTRSISSVFAEAWDASKVVVNSDGSHTYQGLGSSGNYSFNSGDEYQRQAAFKGVAEAQLADVNNEIKRLQNAIGSINGQINYLEALKNQPLEGLNSNSSGANKNDKKRRKELIDDLKKIYERYHEITREIKDQERALKSIEKENDRIYGKKRLFALKQQRINLKHLIFKQSDLAIKQFGDLGFDLDAVQKAFNGKAEIDSEGNLSNYTELLEMTDKKLQKAIDTYNSSKQTESDKKILEKAEKQNEDNRKLLEQYEKTLDEYHKQQELIQDLKNQVQDLNYQIIMEDISFKVEINELDFKEVEYYLNKMSDDFYQMAESAALLSSKSPSLTQNLETYNKAYNTLNKAYQEGKITQKDYIEGLKEIRSNTYDNLESLIELDKQMKHYYENTLNSATEELNKYMTELTHYTSILEHFENMLGLLGKENDFNRIGTILQGQLKTTQNTLKIQKNQYEMLLSQKEQLATKLERAPLGSKEREMLQQEYNAIKKAVIEAEEAVYSTTEALGELANKIYDTSLKQYRQELEKSLAGQFGMSNLDQYLQKIDQLSKSQEEYLTKTNQLYETNKLIRQAELDMDKTSNLQAKKEYQNYIESIKKLSEKEKLSQYELEIAQARYKVLQAQMALEDSKNNKNSMRLVRNSSGNWDYVYTADEKKIENAQQALEDAQNDLYNIGLNGAKDYQSKYAETMKEAVEAFEEINRNHKNGMYASEEEYNKAMADAKKYYYDLLKTYEELYHTGHDLMVEESANKEADYIFVGIGNLEEFDKATEQYLDSCNDAYNKWQENTKEVTDLVGDSLIETSHKIDSVTQSSNELAEEIIGNVIPFLEKELNAVDKITAAWANQRDELYEIIKAYEELAKSMSQTIKDTANEKPDLYAKDYSQKMLEAYMAGDMETYEIWKNKRQEKESNNPSSTDVSTSRLDRLFQAAFNDNNSDALYIIEQVKKNKQKFTDAFLKKYGFNTGGYTGEWGPEGRIAMLHEKELVLNKTDTGNILSAVNLIRAIGPNLFNQIKEILNNNRMGEDPFLKTVSMTNFSDEEKSSGIEQNIVIQADFPGVSAAVEIEAALRNLANDAAQHASIRK